MGTFYVNTKPGADWRRHLEKGEIPPWWRKIGDNKIVRGGAAWLEDLAAGIETNWTENRIGYMAIGTSLDTNAGIEGPADGSPLPDDGPWQGASSLDFRLSIEHARAPVSMTRMGDVLIIGALFPDTDFPSDVELRELGIFLDGEEGGTNRPPGVNPFDSVDERPFAMVARSTRFTHDEGENEYLDNPLVAPENQPLELFYTMRFS